MGLDIGNRIKEIRTESGLSQADFGEKLDITGDQVGKIENGSRRPSEEAMIRLKDEFNVSIDYLYTGSEFVMPRLPENMNMNLQTSTAKKAIEELNKVNVCTKTIAQSIKTLDMTAVLGIQYYENELKKVRANPEIERNIRAVRMEGSVAN